MSSQVPRPPSLPDRNAGPVNQTYFDRQWSQMAQSVAAVAAQTDTNTAAIAKTPTSTPSTPNTPPTGTRTSVVGTKAFGTSYTNSSSYTMNVVGYTTCNSGSSTGTITVLINGVQVWGNELSATVAGGDVGFNFDVLPGESYTINASGDVSTHPTAWDEITYA